MIYFMREESNLWFAAIFTTSIGALDDCTP